MNYRLALTVVTIGGVLAVPAAPTRAASYRQPDAPCSDIDYEFSGPVRPDTCRIILGNRGTRHEQHGRLSSASWRTWNHKNARGVGLISTRRQEPVRIKIRLSKPNKAVYQLDPPFRRWSFTRFQFKFVSHPTAKWLTYQDGEGCDSFSDWTC